MISGGKNLHLALWGVLGARDIKGIEFNMVSFNILDNEHLQRKQSAVFEGVYC